MSFASGVEAWTRKVNVRRQRVFLGVVTACMKSIQFGSPITGAKGQVVADDQGGELRDSWHVEMETPHRALISTSVPWAQQNEDGVARPGGGKYEQKAAVGGRWSVKLTADGFNALVADEVAKLGDG